MAEHSDKSTIGLPAGAETPKIKILMIGYAYPPSSSPGSVRMSRLAARLDREGCAPFILTVGAKVGSRNSGLDDPLSADRVFRTDDPLAKVVSAPSADIGARSGGPAFSLKAFAGRLIFPDRTIFWALRLKSWSAKIRELNPDVILSSSPPLSAHIAGRYFAKQTGAKWIAEFRDPVSWLSQSDDTSKLKRWLLSKFERWAVRNADLSVTISDGFSDYFRQLYPAADIRTIANGAEVNEAKIAKNVAKYAQRTTDGPLVIVHAGALYGGVRDPNSLISAAKMVQAQTERKIELHFVGADSYLASDAAQKQDASDLVFVHGAMGHAETVAMTEQASGLVALQHNDPVARIGIMSKFFDYVATGNPVLVVGEQQAMLSQIVEEEGAGAACEYDDIDGIAAWILKLANDPKSMQTDALSICRKWSADKMAARMGRLIRELAATTP